MRHNDERRDPRKGHSLTPNAHALRPASSIGWIAVEHAAMMVSMTAPPGAGEA